VGGTTLTIRKFHSRFFTVDELKRIGTVTDEVITRLKRAVERRENILISGGTGTGKTTLLNALSAFISDTERLIVIEDTAEIQIASRNLVRFEARRSHPNLPAVTIRDLLRAALRHRPDRIILGEVRGGEAFDLLQALNTGHSGSLSTIHANSADQAISRLITCVLQSGVELPYDAIRSAIADSISLLLHVEKWKTHRYVSQLLEIKGYDHTNRQYKLKTNYERHPRRS
jgi:pilus assembly protein CpaF